MVIDEHSYVQKIRVLSDLKILLFFFLTDTVYICPACEISASNASAPRYFTSILTSLLSHLRIEHNLLAGSWGLKCMVDHQMIPPQLHQAVVKV